MDYKPKGQLVIVKPDKIDEVTEGGLYIPDVARENHQKAITHGKIVAMGPDVNISYLDDKGVKQPFKIGDRVIYAKYGGSSFYYTDDEGRNEYRVLFDEDIAILIGDEKQPIGPARKPIGA